MNSFRVLLASSDPEYDRAFSAWMKKKHPPFTADLLDPQRWFEWREEDFDAYDRILLGGALKHIHKGSGVRIADGFGPGNEKKGSEQGLIDPYRSAEEVFRDLINERESPFKLRTLGIALTEGSEAMANAAENLIASLANTGETILRADLREFPSDDPAVFRRDGCRSWDDFLYCCIYAKTPDLLINPGQYASQNDLGVLRFPMSAGPNPYHTLNDNELRMMYGRLREFCPVDYFAAFLPESDSPVYGPTLNQMDLILFLYHDSEKAREQIPEKIRQLKQKTDPSKRILEICVSYRYEDSDLPGFLLHVKDENDGIPWIDSYSGLPPEDLAAITEFIRYGCYI